MREVLDCAVLFTPGHESGMQAFIQAYAPHIGRIRLHEQRLFALPPALSASPPDVQALLRVALTLKRFDCCLLPVCAQSLPWVRMALYNAQPELCTPILALAHDMRAPAIEDLFRLGIADFMLQNSGIEEMRVRLARVAEWPRHADASSARVQEPVVAYGAQAVLRPRVSPVHIEHELQRMQAPVTPAVAEPFRVAKARLVNGFERDYVRRALLRHCGNVAQAARASQKHRRAFWALMRKHRIDASPFRTRGLADAPDSPPDAV